MGQIIVCKDCKKEKPHKARGLCATCYNKRNRDGDFINRPLNIKRGLTICKSCKQERPHLAHGMCRECYQKWRRQKVIICKECGQEKAPAARGLCTVCYNRQRDEQHPKFCAECGQRISQNPGVTLCHPCSMKGERNPNFKHGKYYDDIGNFCIDCGIKISPRAIRCPKCSSKGEQNPNWKDGLGWLRARLQADLRNKLRNSPYALTPKQAKEVLAPARCFYCGEEMPPQKLEFDHFVPVNGGGLTTRGNMTIACKSCNMEKWDRSPTEILTQLTFSEPI